jgi:hypothetical protein
MSLRRSAMAAMAGLVVVAAPVLAQRMPNPPPPPAPTSAPVQASAAVVGSNPATFAELMEATDLCRRATHSKARFDYRLLRDEGYGVGSRRWDQPAGKERGELVWGFGKGNVAVFVRHGISSLECRVLAWVSDPKVADAVRSEILARKWAKPFEEGAPPALQEKMRKENPTFDFSKVLIGTEWLFGIDRAKNSAGKDIVSVSVRALGGAK